MTILTKPIAIGRTAEVYAWEAGQVLKLFHDWVPPNWVEKEQRVAQSVGRAGVPSPGVGGIVEVNGRRGIVYERVDGPSMLSAMQRQPLRLAAFGRMLAELHLTMHRSAITDLPPQRRALDHDIRAAKTLPDDLREYVLQALGTLPDGDRLCHADFHPDNVLLTPRGPMVIDWMTAVSGHPAADVARTRLVLTIGDPPAGSLLRLLLRFGRKLFVDSYERCYRQAAPEIFAQSEAFLPVMAAARLNEAIPNEREKLIQMVMGDWK